MISPVRTIARAVAKRLADEYGPELPAEVESALYRPSAGMGLDEEQRQYVDPVALGGLIVSVATLAWTVYAGLRRDAPKPPREVVERTVRVRLGERTDSDAASRDRVIEVVVAETIRAAELDAGADT